MSFRLTSRYKPTDDQPEAIQQLTDGIHRGDPAQVLLGVTGSGKTFTVVSVISNVQMSTLILNHNKTLAAQLYEEMKGFFPENTTEYYVSYHDYYQPKTYLPTTGLYTEEDLAINDEIDRLRLSVVGALSSGRKDVIVVSFVPYIYGMGDSSVMTNSIVTMEKRERSDRNGFSRKLVEVLYVRSDIDLQRGNFRAKGDTVDIAVACFNNILRITQWDEGIDSIEKVDGMIFRRLQELKEYHIYPTSLFVTAKKQTEHAIRATQDGLVKQVGYFNGLGGTTKAQHVKERVEYDIEMIKELGYCSDIKSYSRHLDGRGAGQRLYCLLDFFSQDFLLIVGKSHVSAPQISTTYGGDRVRKQSFVEYGFCLPAASSNRPLRFEEFHDMLHQTTYASVTSANYEPQEAEGVMVGQVIRPAGLLGPEIDVCPSEDQIDDFLDEILQRTRREGRVLVTALTKRIAEELTEYLLSHDVRANYIHSDMATSDCVKIITDLRTDVFDVLVGANLLHEGLDLPEVSLVVILDTDKEGFLRSHRSPTQTAGCAARSANGKVITYADTITESMQCTIDEATRCRSIQLKYNEEYHITLQQIAKEIKNVLPTSKENEKDWRHPILAAQQAYTEAESGAFAVDSTVLRMTREQFEKSITNITTLMKRAVKDSDSLRAAQYGDEIVKLQATLKRK